MPKGPDEPADIAFMQRTVFAGGATELEPFSDAERLAGKTPDFRLKQAGQLAGYCELKSPRDDWLDELLEQAGPGEIVGGGRDDPTFNRLRRHVRKAAKQFEAVDPSGDYPHILVFVNHDDSSDIVDLHAALHGQYPNGIPTQAGASEPAHRAATDWIDLIVWVDARTGKVRTIGNNIRNERAAQARKLVEIAR